MGLEESLILMGLVLLSSFQLRKTTECKIRLHLLSLALYSEDSGFEH